MPEDEFTNTLWRLSQMYNQSVAFGGIGSHRRWTFHQVLSDGRRVTDMVIANPIH